MNHRERIHAALRGEPLDHVPVALWRHFPNDDLRPDRLAASVVEFQNKYDFDLVKVTPASGYPAEMYGATFRDGKNREGTRAYLVRPINNLGDWDRVVPVEPTHPVFARETAALKSIRQKLGPDVPILQTIFSPLNSAHNLAGDRLFHDLRAHPEVLHRALKGLTETTVRFAIASLSAGADAVFFATQMATRKYLDEEEFGRFGEPYDLQVLQGIQGAHPDFILLHIHGLDIYFDRLARWPVQAINWHDRRTPPALKDARGKFNGALVGGIDEWNVLASGTHEAVVAQVRDAAAQTGRRGLIVAGGCVIPVDTPDENIRAVLEAAAAP